MKSTGKNLLWRSKKGILVSPKAPQEKRQALPGDSKAEEQEKTGEEEVPASGPVAPGGPTGLLERTPPGAAAQTPALNRRQGLPGRAISPPTVFPPRQVLPTVHMP